MADMFGKSYSRPELLRRTGSIEQIAGIREYTYDSGRAAGTKAISVDTGRLRFEVLPSRCLDVSAAGYRGVPFGYLSKSGIRHPAYFSKIDSTGFMDNFFGGPLTTCGLHNIGSPRELNGKKYELHGEMNNIPAEKVGVAENWNGDECEYVVTGEMRHSRFYAEDLVLKRKITAKMGGSSICIEDEIENQDFAPSMCLLLYHCQFGFPFLDAETKLFTSPAEKIEARPGVPPEKVRDCKRFSAPVDGEAEQCFYHYFKPDADGNAAACLFNPNLGEKGMGVFVKFDARTLPYFVEWKMLRSREYVCGLEPGTALLDDRDGEVLRASELQPLEKRAFKVEIGVVEGESECRRFVGEA